MTKFSIMDGRQVIVASFVSTLFFLVIRAGNPFEIESTIGIIITIAVIWLSKPKPKDKNLNIYGMEIIISYITVGILSVAFKLTDLNTITFGLLNGTGFNLNVFSSAAIVAFWLALPVSVIYNRDNLDNFLSRIYIKKRP